MSLLKQNLIFITVIFSFSTFAKVFETDFIKLQLPEGWACELSNNQYICQDQKYKKQNYALLILTAKKSSPDDTLASYQNYLSKPINRVTQDFKELKSKVIKSGKSVRNGIEWVESSHKNSEAPGYTTRYFATTHRGLSILVSLSVNEKYLSIFDRLFAKTWDTLELKSYTEAIAGTQNPNSPLLTEQDFSQLSELPTPSSSAEFVANNSAALLTLALVLVTAFFAFIFLKNRRK